MSNFLVLVSDEHNPLYSEPYGHTSVKTPNMQAIADRGVVFESAYCPSPLCMPSRSAFIAGKRVHTLQTYSNCNVLVDSTPLSFGAALKVQGSHTAYIGKTDVYAPGCDLGFSEMMSPDDRRPPGDTHHRRNPMTIRTGAAIRAEGYGPKEDASAHDIARVEQAVQWLKSTATGLHVPWVLVVNITAPHFPHFARPEFWDLYPGDGDLPKYGPGCESARHPYAAAIKRHFETHAFTEEQTRGLRKGYLACISFVDHQLGLLRDALDESGLSDTTNLVYTSDHGEMLGKFGMWWKCSLYEDSVRIPMIAAGPDFSGGKRVATPVDLHDLQATLFAATGALQPRDFLGSALQSMPIKDPERRVFSEYHGHGAPGSSYMIRKGEWKYLHYTNAPCQLFDLNTDPDELYNVAETFPLKVLELAAELDGVCSPCAENDRAEQFINRQLEWIGQVSEQGSRGDA